MIAWAKPAAIAGAAGLLAGFAVGVWVTHEFYAPRLELAENKVKDLGQKLQEQNDAVAKLEQETKDLTERARKAQARAAKLRAELDKMADDIITLPPPPPGEDHCKAASDLIRRELSK